MDAVPLSRLRIGLEPQGSRSSDLVGSRSTGTATSRSDPPQQEPLDVTPDLGQVTIGGFRLRSAPPRG